MQSKKQLLRLIRKESRPPAGFGQWLLIFEARKLSEELGLLRLEGYNDKKLQWSGSLSINLPEVKSIGLDGKEQTTTVDWDKIGVGKSTFRVLTFELKGKTLWEERKAS